ncbi:MAG: helix-turn-helix transcriptional regulator [Eubacterium sp.]|nr:helix-turn-helix transcriptional regulator [Eubacterium sp.]
MYEWNESIQKMIDWIEEHITESPTLLEMSKQIGYSPYYCSVRFHEICGMTIKSYVSLRRLTLAAVEIKNTSERIIDIAVKYGYSSQEALTRAFSAAFGCTPAAFRVSQVPIPLFGRKEVFHPWHYDKLYKGGITMSEFALTEARVRVEYIPAHKYIGIWDEKALGYGDFWENHDCDRVCGIIESMRDVSHPVVTGHTAGWTKNDRGERRYFYGIGVDADYDGVVPEGFEIREFPGSYYMVFYHPPFDYMKDNGEVMGRVENLAWNYDLKDYKDFGGSGYEWNEDICQCYQRHYPEGLGYQILRPIKKANK